MNNKPIRVLLIEDKPEDTLLIQRMLSRTENPSFDLECIDRLSVGVERLSGGEIDDDEKIVIKAAQEGAQDYLVKGQVDSNLLVRSIHYAIEHKRTEEELRKRRCVSSTLS